MKNKHGYYSLTCVSAVFILTLAALFCCPVHAEDSVTLMLTDNSDLTIYNDSYTLNGDSTSFSGSYILTGGTSETDYLANVSVTIADGYSCEGRAITLNELYISSFSSSTVSNGKCAFALAGSAKVNLVLNGTNFLMSSIGRAGLEASSETGSLTISGDGSLTAVSIQSGAGIGGGGGADGCNITINGGTINAVGGESGAGIGGGNDGTARNITINGGSVTAVGNASTGDVDAADGIGAGEYGSEPEDIQLLGGTITTFGCGNGWGVQNASLGADVKLTALSSKSGRAVSLNSDTPVIMINYAVAADADAATSIVSDSYSAAYTPGDFEINLPYQSVAFSVPLGSYTVKKDDVIQCFDCGTNTVFDLTKGGLTSFSDVSSHEISSESKTIKMESSSTLSIYYDRYVLNDESPVFFTGSYVLTGGSSDSPLTGTSVTVHTSYTAADRSITLDSLYIENNDGDDNSSGTCAFSIEGSAGVDLRLTGSSQLQSGNFKAGIQTAPEGSLAISGEGSLTVYGGARAAGIGGGAGEDGTNITINGGTISAFSAYDRVIDDAAAAGAAIGGGYEGNGSNITINDGTINANISDTSGNGAGIGGGNSGGNGTDITINGGTVNASGNSAAGIGGGSGGSGSRITITGGIVNTESSFKGAGIGGGSNGKGTDITISGGTVTATGGYYYGCGIGGGYNGSSDAITITGGTVKAVGLVAGAGIGASKGFSGGDISITGGSVTAIGRVSGAGIGNGIGYTGTDGSVSIGPDADVTAVSDVENGAINTNSSENTSPVLLINYFENIKGTIETAVEGDGVSCTPSNYALNWKDSENVYRSIAFNVPEGKYRVTGGGTIQQYSADGQASMTFEAKDSSSPSVYSGVTDYVPDGSICLVSGDKLVIYDESYDLNGTSTDYTESYVLTGGASDNPLSGTSIIVADGYNGTNKSVTIDDLCIRNTDGDAVSHETAGTAAFSLEGSASLDLRLSGSSLLQSGAMRAGLETSSTDVSLTISGDGELKAVSTDWGAAIGGAGRADGANITINSGTIIAESSNTQAGGSGIGGGADGAGYNITINGGTVYATGGFFGAGIGGSLSVGDNITITGGTVNATGGTAAGESTGGGAGIGGGASSSGSNITISGGTVNATGGTSSAGIGGGSDGHGVDIRISGGIVTAAGSARAAGIGGGSNGICIDLVISSDSIVTAVGGASSAALGNGDNPHGSGSSVTIESGADVTLISSQSNGIFGTTEECSCEIPVIQLNFKESVQSDETINITDGNTVKSFSLSDCTTAQISSYSGIAFTASDGNWSVSRGDDIQGWNSGKEPVFTLDTDGLTAFTDIAPYTAPTQISLDQSEMSLTVGETGTITVSGILPEDATNTEIIWTSSNTDAASVSDDSSTGVTVKAVGQGETVITAVSASEPAVTAECTVYVNEPVNSVSAVLTAPEGGAAPSDVQLPEESGCSSEPVTWTPAVDGTFAYETQYTAEFTLTPDELYYFTLDTTLSIDGAESTSCTLNTDGTITAAAVFPKTDEPGVTGIEVKPPTKTDYMIGESLDTQGMTVTAVYADGTTKTAALENVEISPSRFTKAGTQTVTVTYEGQTAAFEVNVTMEESISIESSPDKTAYIPGETLDLTGLKVVYTASDGTRTDVTSDCSSLPADGAELDETDLSVTVTYNSLSAAFDITVAPSPLVSINVTTAPDKTEYVEGQLFDGTGMVVTAAYEDGTTKSVTPSWTVQPLTVDDTSVTLTYTENGAAKTTAVSITVSAYTPPAGENAQVQDPDGSGEPLVTDDPEITLENIDIRYSFELEEADASAVENSVAEARTDSHADYVQALPFSLKLYIGDVEQSVTVSLNRSVDITIPYNVQAGMTYKIARISTKGDGSVSFLDAGVDLENKTITVSTDSLGFYQVIEKKAVYTVSFDSCRGSDVEAVTGLALGSTVSEPETPIREGFDFTGWYKDAACTSLWNFDVDTVSSDVTLYAGWRSLYTAGVTYEAHVQNYGWMDSVSDGATAGTTGERLQMEALKINVTGDDNLGITYRAHVQNVGWQDWVSDGEEAGTTGENLRIEAVQIRLTGENADQYDVFYRVHNKNTGWSSWTCNGLAAGTEGLAYRAEAVEILVLPKNSEQAPVTGEALISRYGNTQIRIQSHVQNDGWLAWSGETTGTTGRALRMEAIRMSLSPNLPDGSIVYSAHVQNIGWTSDSSDGAQAGTTGLGLRVEAVRISLTGEIAQTYDVYYRAYVENVGWMDWVKNGENAGTNGQALRMESLQVKLVEKE